jgi:pyruvate/2-oxoglutarate dehydrogenase complex dihydrolipoamide dehydrogenase (E3) component
MINYDLIVIGGGSGGLTVAAGAAMFGVKVALIEKEAQPGGDCLHTGCVPSKALIAAAKELYTARKAAEAFGLELHGEADYQEAYRRVQAAKAFIQPHDSGERFRSLGVDVYQGFGRFQDDHHIQIEGGTAAREEHCHRHRLQSADSTNRWLAGCGFYNERKCV